MKLLSSGASPYVSKAVMAATFAGIDVDVVGVDATNGDPQLDAANPLSKIPCLVLNDGTSIYDSRNITRYIDRLSGGKLIPVSNPLPGEKMEALCDGLNDVLVGSMYELRFRPEEKVHQPWLDRLWGKANRALDAIAADLPPSGKDAHIGSIALAATLGYLALRFAGRWEEGRQALIDWESAFYKTFPDLAGLKPHA